MEWNKRVKAEKKKREPRPETLMAWMESGKARATDDCWVEPDGKCPHGCESWFIVLGLI